MDPIFIAARHHRKNFVNRKIVKFLNKPFHMAVLIK